MHIGMSENVFKVLLEMFTQAIHNYEIKTDSSMHLFLNATMLFVCFICYCYNLY